jgi:tRNA G10  N-methylase Trm11
MKVIGADVNVDFVRGTRDNLKHTGFEYDDDKVKLYVKVSELFCLSTVPIIRDVSYSVYDANIGVC